MHLWIPKARETVQLGHRGDPIPWEKMQLGPRANLLNKVGGMPRTR